MRSNGSRHLLGNYIIIIAWSDYEWQLSDSKTLLLVPAAKCCTTFHSPPIRPRPLLFVFPAIVVGVAVAVVGEILIKTFARNRQGEGARDKERGRGRNEASKSVGRNINHNVGRGQEKLMKLSRCMRRLQPSRRVVVATTTPYGCLRCDQSCWRTCTRGAFGLPGCMLQLMLHAARGDAARDPIHALFRTTMGFVGVPCADLWPANRLDYETVWAGRAESEGRRVVEGLWESWARSLCSMARSMFKVANLIKLQEFFNHII